MSVSVSFPDELLLASKEDKDSFARSVMIYTLGHLYTEGKISSGVGAGILRCSRFEFYRLLSERGFSVIDYPGEELEEEARSSQELAQGARGR